MRNQRTALEKDFYVIIMNGKEGLSYPGTYKSVGHKSAGTVHGVFSGFCLFGEIMMLSSRNILNL